MVVTDFDDSAEKMAKVNLFHDRLGRFARAPETGSGSGGVRPSRRFAEQRKAILRFRTETAHFGHIVHHEIAPLSGGTLAEIRKKTGNDLAGFTAVADNGHLNHGSNRHGAAAAQSRKDQLPLTHGDYGHIPEIMLSGAASPGHPDRRGAAAILMTKVIGDHRYSLVAEIWRKQRKLAFVTMWKEKA